MKRKIEKFEENIRKSIRKRNARKIKLIRNKN